MSKKKYMYSDLHVNQILNKFYLSFEVLLPQGGDYSNTDNTNIAM